MYSASDIRMVHIDKKELREHLFQDKLLYCSPKSLGGLAHPETKVEENIS
jgi:hypothetical protein